MDIEKLKLEFYKETDELLGGTFRDHVRDAIWQFIETKLSNQLEPPVKPEIADLTDGQKIDAILLWQNSEEVHPLTCGCSATNNDEKKFEIVGKRLNGKLYIECTRCGIIQDWIPDSVYNYYIRKQFSV